MKIEEVIRRTLAAFPCAIITSAAIKYIGIPEDILLFTYLLAGFGIAEMLSWVQKDQQS